jgi:16S rRNA (cytidine1402-2'-O)-methyltransferase
MLTLYLVSTPIGNLKDITLRAIEVLGHVDIIVCEDTRKTGRLLKYLQNLPTGPTIVGQIGRNFKPRLISYYEENALRRIPQIINFLKQGKNVALVANAGTPTISDPGFKLVRECIRQKIKVESIPGPSAVLAALTTSGLPTDKFLFLGFLPKKESKRQKIWQSVITTHSSVVVTVILFESPYRLLKTLKEIKKNFGDIQVVICRELTKIHEEIRREKVSQSIEHFSKTKPKGEFTILFNLKNLSN